MIDSNKVDLLRSRIARQHKIASRNALEQNDKKNSVANAQEKKAKLKIEITDKIEISERKWLSSENWIG